MNSLRALAVASILAAGCVAPQSGQEPIQSPPRSTYTEAQRMVGPRPENLQNGYFTSPFSRSTMTTIAGVYAGTVQVQRTQSKSNILYSYSWFFYNSKREFWW